MHEEIFIAEGAKIIGDIRLEEGCSVWYNAVVRSSAGTVFIGKNTNIQDLACLHVDKKYRLSIGSCVTIGHGAIVHGCQIGNNVLIGMGAILLNDAEIGDNCIIGAGALITEGKKIPAGSLVYGNPARIIRTLTIEEIKDITENALHYVEEAKMHIV